MKTGKICVGIGEEIQMKKKIGMALISLLALVGLGACKENYKLLRHFIQCMTLRKTLLEMLVR